MSKIYLMTEEQMGDITFALCCGNDRKANNILAQLPSIKGDDAWGDVVELIGKMLKGGKE